MKTYNVYYEKNTILDLPVDEINSSKSILIQVFTGIVDKNHIREIIDYLLNIFPSAYIIGATTDGEINNSKISLKRSLISVSSFEDTTITSYSSKNITLDNSFLKGENLALSLVCKDTKAMIVFIDGLNSNGEEFLNGIHGVSKDIVVIGGMAADNGEFIETIVFTQDGICESGVVGISLNSKNLNVYTDYKLDWQPVGKRLKITNAYKNRVYSIDNMKAAEVYKHYLGEGVYDQLPKTGVEFPLIKQVNGVSVARAVLSKNSDGSLDFAGNIDTGKYYQFGMADINSMVDSRNQAQEQFESNSFESIFVYSCMARRRFFQDLIVEEIKPLNRVATVGGFFTYGEFFYNKNRHSLLNQTMTVVGFSEKVKDKDSISKQNNSKNIGKTLTEYTTTLSALSHLISVSSSELEELNRTIDNTALPLLSSGPVINFNLEISGSATSVLYISPNVEKIFGYSSKEFLHNEINILKLIYKKDLSRIIKSIHDIVTSNGLSCESEFKFFSKNKELKYAYVFAAIERDRERGIVQLHGYVLDITEQKKSQEQIHFLAYHDGLTSLPNRVLLNKRFEKVLSECSHSNFSGAVLFLDLNRFKIINDTLGHDVGDKLLVGVSQRIRAVLKKKDLLARLGGDEFVILLTKLRSDNPIQSVEDVARRIKRSLEIPIEIGKHTIYASVSIGATVFEDDRYEIKELLRQADDAMYLSKKDKSVEVSIHKHKILELI